MNFSWRSILSSPHTKLFRKKALDRLASPDQLDQLLEITSSKGWFALGAVGFCLVMAIGWGVYGSIPTKVSGSGIIIGKGGVFEVPSLSTGQIDEILVSVGVSVETGQIIAIIDQPELTNQIKAQEERLGNMTERLEKLKGDTDVTARIEYLGKQRELVESSIETMTGRIGWYKEKISNQGQLLADGLITKTQLLNTENEFDRLVEQIEAKRNEISSIELSKMDLAKNRENELKLLSQQLEETTTSLDNLKLTLKMTSSIKSTYSGRVVEVKVKKGSLVSTGLPVITLELSGEGNELEAILYVSPMDGKKVKAGMTAQIAPTTVKTEEYGFMLGMVTYVSEYPTTAQQMMLMLQNKELVGTLSQGASPIAVKASLISDPNTLSGFRWSSPLGPPIVVQSGTMCSATMTVMEQQPITLVIPWFKKKLGL